MPDSRRLGAGQLSAVVALVMPVAGKLFDLRWYNAAFSLVRYS